MAASLSPQSSHHSPPPKASPPPPPAPVYLQQNRPSVLRVAHKQGDHVVPPADCVSVPKIKRMRTDEPGQEVVTITSAPLPSPPPPRSVGVVVSPVGASSGSKRKSDDSSAWPITSATPVATSQPSVSMDLQPPLSPHFQLESVEQLLTSVDGPLFFGKFNPRYVLVETYKMSPPHVFCHISKPLLEYLYKILILHKVYSAYI